MFSIYYWPITLLFAALSAAMAGGLSLTGNREGRGNLVLAVGGTFILDLLLQRIGMYYVQPTFTGSFFGFFSPLFIAMIVALPVGCGTSGASKRAVGISVLSVLALFLWPTVQYATNAWGPSNAKAFAEIPNIRVAPADEHIPPTDPNHLVRVSRNMAAFKARMALTSKTGKGYCANYSTCYQVGGLTLQAINNHRYWAAPLVPTNNTDTFWTPLFGGVSESPGYVLVDAEDPEAAGDLRDGYHITLFEDGAWNMNLSRFAYMQGYDKGDLEDATFEVADDYTPHWTLTYVTPAFGNITGRKVTKVLVVDVGQAQPKLQAYEPADPAIAWVDRVVSRDMVKGYAKDWGKYGPLSSGNWFGTATGQNTQGVMEPADGDEGIMLSYTTGSHNVWVVPMTSLNSSDHSVMGLLVFDTQKNSGTFYPGLRGFNHGGSVTNTMFGANDNAQTKFGVEYLELYNIYGKLTWVAIYTRSQSNGSTFGGIGFMEADKQNVSDVAFAKDLPTALNEYLSIMARGSDGMHQTPNSHTKTFEGTIWRIGNKGGNSQEWRFIVLGDNQHFFEADLKSYQGMPTVRDGDKVSGVYLDTDNQVVHVIELHQMLPQAPQAVTKPVVPAAVEPATAPK